MNKIQIAPNKPVYLALVDPAGKWDGEHREFRYQTTTGESLVLPPPAAEQLFYLSPAAGERIRIQKVWSGLQGERPTWEITRLQHQPTCNAVLAGDEAACNCGHDNMTHTAAHQDSPQAPGRPAAPGSGSPEARAILQAPTPISRPARNEYPQPEQPTLFDRGTGTYGPRPRPARSSRPAGPQIPANIAVKEILEFINADPGTQNWGDQPKQGLASTILIAAYKAGHIGLWERNEK